MIRLPRKFYTRKTLVVAKELLGKYLVRRVDKKKLVGKLRRKDIFLRGKIVETEAYIGPKDRASHAFGGKITPRNKTEYLIGGHIYIYLCYGMYWQLNITTSRAGKPECVLIRALEPAIADKHEFTTTLTNKNSRKSVSKFVKIRKLASGPGKLCQWLKLNKSFNTEDLCKSKRIWLENRGEKIKKSEIVAAKRIGIEYAGPWEDKPWRFYIRDNSFVSKK